MQDDSVPPTGSAAGTRLTVWRSGSLECREGGLCCGTGKDWGLFSKHNDHHLDQTNQVGLRLQRERDLLTERFHRERSISRLREEILRRDSKPQTYVLPLVQVGQVDFAVGVDVLAGFYHHGACRFDKADGGVVGIGVQQPQTHRDVVGVS